MPDQPATLHPFFHGLSEENQVLLARVTQRRQVPVGQFLFRQGDPADTALFVERGRVELEVRLPGGGHLALPASEAGSVLGELALVERHRRSATARVVEEMQALEMHRDDLRALCAVRHPASLSMLRRLARLVAARLHEINAERVPQRSADTHVVDRAAWQPGATFDLSRFLPVLPLFVNFSAADIQTVLDAAQVWTIGAAQPIALYDDPPGGCFVVLRGAVEAVAPTVHGTRRLAVFGPGAPIGILSALLTRPHSATWVARERATLLELPAQALAVLRDPGQRASFRFHEAVLRALIQYLEQATRALTGERRLRPVL